MIPWWKGRTREQQQGDMRLLGKSVPDLREYAGAVFVVMRQLGIGTLVLHTEFGECRLDLKEINE